MFWSILALMACKDDAQVNETGLATEVPQTEPPVATPPPPTDTGTSRVVPPVTANRLGIRGHAQECQQALGPIPGFDCIEDAVPMPVTVDGQPVTETPEVCDKPSLLEGSCNVFTRVGRKAGTWMNGDPRPEVSFVFTCRSSDDGPPTDEGGVYHDVAMIGYNEETGATCYFQSFPDGRIRYFPSPLTAGGTPDYGTLDARFIWDPPMDTAGINCHRCHGADPWIHSPWIDQLDDPSEPGEPIVPWMNGTNPPYHVVGTAFRDWTLDHIAPADNQCLSCHRMHAGNSPQGFIRYSTGGQTGMPLTDFARTFPMSHWMPPAPGMTEEDWEAQWRADVDELLLCADEPDQGPCNESLIDEGDRYIDPDMPDDSEIFVDTAAPADTGLSCGTPDGDLGSALGDLVSANTCGAGHDYLRSCGEIGSNGEDLAYTWTAPSTGVFAFDTFGAAYDTTLSARTTCAAGDTELDCNDDTVDTDSQITLSLTEGDSIVLVVDTWEGPRCGDFTLRVVQQ